MEQISLAVEVSGGHFEHGDEALCSTKWKFYWPAESLIASEALCCMEFVGTTICTELYLANLTVVLSEGKIAEA